MRREMLMYPRAFDFFIPSKRGCYARFIQKEKYPKNRKGGGKKYREDG